MNIKKVFRAMVTVVIMLAVIVSAQAQKPSAAAIAADPKASDNTVQNGYTLSYAQIRAAYEKLPDNIYLKPYYHPDLKNYYYLDDSQDIGCWNQLKTLFSEMPPRSPRNNLEDKNRNGTLFITTQFAGLPFMYTTFANDVIPAGNQKVYEEAAVERKGSMPYGTHAIFTYLALYAADPKGFIPFEKFCYAFVGYGIINRVKWDTGNFITPDEKTFPDGTKIKMSVPWGNVVSNMRKEVVRLHDITFKETPIIVIQSAAAKYYNNVKTFEKEEKYESAMHNFFLFEVAMYFWKYNDKFKKDETFDYLMNEYNKFLQKFEEWRNGAMLSGTPVEMPKTYDMGADLARKALETARNEFSSYNVEKVVFTSDKWTELKDTEWPYPITSRITGSALLSKEGDKWLIRYYTFIQYSDGKGKWVDRYGFQAGTDGYKPKVVNYKP